MDQSRIYITVILPLRLEWNPYYYVEAGQEVYVGDKVRVAVSGRRYTGVVYEVGVTPVIPENKIHSVSEILSLDRVSDSEIKLWEFISDYYLCTIGEVYKAAYPVGKLSDEQIVENMKLRARIKKERQSAALMKKAEGLESKIAKRQEKRALIDVSKLKNLEKISLIDNQLSDLLKQLDEVRSAMSLLNAPQEASQPCMNLSEIFLSDAQNKAYDEILNGFKDNKIVLLNGITGSGKTEIYCKLAQEALKQGKNVLYLVPEIALSRQLEDRLSKVFGDCLHTYHSGESYVSRREAAIAMKEGPCVLLGTRSSIFLPHRNLGLIIVDEEHDQSYKQDNPAPRYNGKDCAIMMGGMHSCPVILGSATPSMESWYNCLSGRYELVNLDRRYYDGADAQIEIIDTIAERRKRGMVGGLSRKLIAHIHETLEKDEQVLVLRGRKAYSPAVQCEECGTIAKCPHCSVSMSYHKDRNRLVCHSCGHSEVYVGKCPSCGGNRLFLGAGTQKIEEELAGLFPSARVGRLDGDNSSEAANVISDFAAGKMDILVGTQMVSKGFDFENLTLVAVVQSDSLLGQQDFRADEKALQLLAQLRGRSGRRGKESLFVIQTSQPSHPVYGQLGSASGFVSSEMAVRGTFGFPPYTRIVTVILKDSNLPRLEKLSSMLSVEMASEFGMRPVVVAVQGDSSVYVSYPFAPPVDRLMDEHVRHIRITLAKDRNLAGNKARIKTKIANFEREKAWMDHISIDVDPI